MNYKYRRQKAGITFATMVKELGIPESKYKEVEDNKRTLEGNMLDKFIGIINRGKEIQINDMSKINEIDKWIASGEALNAIKKYGYVSQKELAKEVGISQGRISEILNQKEGISDNLKLKLYNFLTNPLNKKANEIKTNKKEVVIETNDYISWVVENLRKELVKNQMSQTDLAKDLSCTNTHISHIICGDVKPSKELAEEIYRYFNNGEKPTIEKPKKGKKDFDYKKWADKNIKKLVKDSGLSQREFAEKVGTSVSNLNHILRGCNGVGSNLAKRIYDYVNKKEEVKEENIEGTILKMDDKEIVIKPLEEETEKVVSDYKELSEIEKKLAQKDMEIIKLKRQIALYEKLISKL